MDIKPILSMDVIKRYIDNIDGIKSSGSLNQYDKQKMTKEELIIFDNNYKKITEKFGKPGESKGGIRWNN